MKKELTAREMLEKEIEKLKKTEKTIYDILALYELKLDNYFDYYHTLTANLLKENIIKDLEDSDVDFPIVTGKYVKDILAYIDTCYRDLYRDYIEQDGCKELLDNMYPSNLQDYVYRGKINILDKFNICEMFDNDLACKILSSYASLNRKLEVLVYCLKENITNKTNCFSSITRILSSADKEVLDAFDTATETHSYNGYNAPMFIQELLNDKRYDYIPHLQEYFNFNNENYLFDVTGKDLNITTVSLVGAVGLKEKSIDNVKELYENDSYMDLPKEIRNNNDLVILENINEENISDFIGLSHFEVTDEKIDTLVNRIISFDEVDKEKFKQLSKKYLDKWSLAILHKAKNKTEYKEMLKYVKKLEEKVKSEIDKIDKERQKLEGYRSLVAVALKELNNKIEERYQKQYSESPKKLRQVLTVEDLNSNKN